MLLLGGLEKRHRSFEFSYLGSLRLYTIVLDIIAIHQCMWSVFLKSFPLLGHAYTFSLIVVLAKTANPDVL